LASVLSSKLRPPAIRKGIVRRRLTERLVGAKAPQLVLLHALAGYGKTLLMAQAFTECHKRGALAAWGSLDATESTAAGLLNCLYAGLAKTVPEEAGSSVCEPCIADFLARVERLGRPFFVFLDDYQHCSGPEADGVLACLVGRVPANLRIIVATRQRPHVGLTTLEVRHQVDIIDSLALAFNEDEFAALRSAKLLPYGVESFLRRAEGWPAMLTFAAVHPELVSGLQSSAAAVSFPALSEYLEQEVLGSVPAEWRAVLIKTSILDELTPELVALLADLHEGWTVLESLSCEKQILSRQYGEAECYRLHPFLRDHLTSRLTRADHAMAPAMHARAAQFFMDQGNQVAAARHAIQSGDTAVIQRLLGHTSILGLTFKGDASLLRMLQSVDPVVARALPHLSFAEIYLMLLANQSRRAAETFRRIKVETQHFTGFMETDALVIDSMIDAYTDDFSIEKITALERKLLEMPATDEILLAVVRQLRLWGEYWNGNFICPTRLSHLLRCESSRAGATFVQIYGYLVLGMCALERGELEQSEAHYRSSIDLAVRLDGLRARQVKTGRLLLAEVAYERNQLERSRNLIEGILDDVELGDSWFDIYASGYLTESMLAFTESLESALAVLRRAEATAVSAGLNRLGVLTTAQRLKLTVMAGELELADKQFALLDRTCHFDGDPRALQLLGWRTVVPALLSAARYHLSRGQPERALQRIAQMRVTLERHRQNRRILEARLLGAIAHYRLSHWDEVAADLSKALEIAGRTGMERVFIDLGESLAAPLDWLLLRRPGIAPGEAGLLRKVRSSLDDTSIPAAATANDKGPGQGASLHLSGREFEVLLAIAMGKTYKEVASELRLSINTVMTHRKKLYGRLDCNSRSRVLSRARALGLIP
jgi:LuxR family transcriptional regulator, maltose regulon positive regulatory protein